MMMITLHSLSRSPVRCNGGIESLSERLRSIAVTSRTARRHRLDKRNECLQLNRVHPAQRKGPDGIGAFAAILEVNNPDAERRRQFEQQLS